MTSTATEIERPLFFVDGGWTAPQGSETQFVIEAATGEPFGTAALGSAADIDAAVRAARRASGARLVTGGGRPVGQDRGWFVEPTVFADVDNRDRLAQEEVFGPVIAVIGFDDDEDAVRIVNDSEYGLAGSVWTADEDRGLALARRVRTGTIGLNRYSIDLGAPFGGMKTSGLGRELGPEALDTYLEYKSLYVGADRLD